MSNQKRYFRWLLIAFLILIRSAAYSQEQQQPGKPAFRIVQISDTQPIPGSDAHWQSVQKTIDLVNSLTPDWVLMPGDVTHSGSEEEFKMMKALLDQIKAPLHVIPGNHDLIFPADENEKTVAEAELHKNKIELYRKYFGPEQWTLEVGDFLFVGNDCTVGWPDVPDERAVWLKEAFSKSDKPYKFIVTHYHPDPQKVHPLLDPMLTSLGVIGYMHGHNHNDQAYEHPESGRLIFSSGSAHYGVMYFDVYDHYIVCFWQPRQGCAIPKGIYDLNQIASKIKPPSLEKQVSPTDQKDKPKEAHSSGGTL